MTLDSLRTERTFFKQRWLNFRCGGRSHIAREASQIFTNPAKRGEGVYTTEAAVAKQETLRDINKRAYEAKELREEPAGNAISSILPIDMCATIGLKGATTA